MKYTEQEIINTLEYFCGSLSHDQKIMVMYNYKKEMLLGIGRAVGRMKYMPMRTADNKTVDVIDRAGYYQIASKEGRRSLENVIKTYKWETIQKGEKR